jgi:hypothetical protein
MYKTLRKISLIAVLLVSALAARSWADAGCTGCVQTDDGTYGCWSNSGNSAWCTTSTTGNTCAEGGYAPKDGCIGPIFN